MAGMDIVLILVVAGLAAAVAWLLATRRAPVGPAPLPPPLVVDVPEEVVGRAVAVAVAEANERAGARPRCGGARRGRAGRRPGARAGARTADASLAGRQELIDQRLGEVQHGVHADLQRLTDLVGQLGEATAERFGQVDRSLHVHAEITNVLADTTKSLREALASSERPWPVG